MQSSLSIPCSRERFEANVRKNGVHTCASSLANVISHTTTRIFRSLNPCSMGLSHCSSLGPCRVGNYTWRRNCKYAALFMMLSFVLVVAIFISVGFPTFDIVREKIIVTLLEKHANRNAIEHSMSLLRVDWHHGAGWKRNEAYSGFTYAKCGDNCATADQAQFALRERLCSITGDVITIHYTVDGTLRSWNADGAVDGC